MKKLLNICLVLWVTLYLGKTVYPEFFGHWAIQWPVFVLLAILVPIGFTKSLIIYFKNENNNLKTLAIPSSFLSIFFIVLIGPIVVQHGFNSLIYFPEYSSIELIGGLTTAKEEKSRLFVARYIFEEYGEKVPYLLDSGTYKVFEPTAEDINKHTEAQKKKQETENLQNQIRSLSLDAMIMSGIMIISFILVFIIILILEQKKLTSH